MVVHQKINWDPVAYTAHIISSILHGCMMMLTDLSSTAEALLTPCVVTVLCE
jgi:hypothetical protein